MSSNTFKIGLFPLGIFLLPGEELPLRIFEPRYKQLIEECIAQELPFGIPFIKEGEIQLYGTIAEVVKVSGKNPNGDMVILIKGTGNFEMLDFMPVLPDKLYGGGYIKKLPNTYTSTNPSLAVLVKKLQLNISPQLGTLITAEAINLFDVAKALMLGSIDKYRFFTLFNSALMEQFLLKQLQFVEKIREQENALQNNFQLN